MFGVNERYVITSDFSKIVRRHFDKDKTPTYNTFRTEEQAEKFLKIVRPLVKLFQEYKVTDRDMESLKSFIAHTNNHIPDDTDSPNNAYILYD